jgi:hypothetical protein
MISQNGSQTTISLQLYGLIANHGLVNVIDIIRMLCVEQSHLKSNTNFADCFKCLEKLTETAAKIETWN